MYGRPRFGCHIQRYASGVCREFVSLVPANVCASVRVATLDSEFLNMSPAFLLSYGPLSRMIVSAVKLVKNRFAVDTPSKVVATLSTV